MTDPALRVWAVLVLAPFGCATNYNPTGPRISLVIQNGGGYYAKGNTRTPIGPLGGDLQDVVSGSDEAVRYARRARTQLAVGVPMYVVGIASVVVGLAISKPTGWVVGGVGVACAGTGMALMGAGFVNAIDAVNVYNAQFSSVTQ